MKWSLLGSRGLKFNNRPPCRSPAWNVRLALVLAAVLTAVPAGAGAQQPLSASFTRSLLLFVLHLVVLFPTLGVALVSEGVKPACIEGWVLALQPGFICL